MIKNHVVIAYHGGPVPIRKFSASHGAQGVMWFSEDREKIERGTSGAASTRFIMTVKLKVKNVAGWDEYERLMLGQIFSKSYGFDAIRLDQGEDGADWVLRDPKRVEVIAVEERPVGGWPSASGRASGRRSGRAGHSSDIDDTRWAYHATLAEFLPAIAKEGLKAHHHPHVRRKDKVIFVERNLEGIEPYLESAGTALRFKTRGFGSTEDGEDVLFEDGGFPFVNGVVPASGIEVRVGSRWVPLLKHVRRARSR